MKTAVKIEGYSYDGETIASVILVSEKSPPDFNGIVDKFYEVNEDMPITSISMFVLYDADQEDIDQLVAIAKTEEIASLHQGSDSRH